MAFTPVSISSPSTSTAVLITDEALQLGLNPIAWAIAQAQEQLHCAMEAQWAEDLWQWMEKSWEEWMSERDSVVRLVDKKMAVAVAKVVTVEI